jgi:ATP-dependent DNA helicase RecG
VDESYEQRLLSFIQKQVDEGGQCYVVCPAIERSEEDEFFTPDRLSISDSPCAANLKTAVEYAEYLMQKLPSLKIGCLHGKMKATEKDKVMAEFSAGRIHVLVSTTVIEVGINVPNSNLMIVRNAERFGLSQLHQLRGRIGRGSRKSYCVLVLENYSESAASRLSVMKRTTDGYEIAEQDLIQRGPGDFFSSNSQENIRQSGGLGFRFAKLCDDTTLFDSAFEMAKNVVERDPNLESDENRALRDTLVLSYSNDTSMLS